MLSRRLATALVLPAFALAACGNSEKPVDSATYTCATFNKSLSTKGDNTSGNFINQLRKQAKLGQAKQTEQREVTLGIYLACRGKPASTQPAKRAVEMAKLIKAGKLTLTPSAAQKKKKSSK